MGEKDEGLEVGVLGVKVKAPAGLLLRTAFPYPVARAEAIAALSASACEKIARGELLTPDERAVHAKVMAPIFKEEEQLARITARAETIYTTEPKLLPTLAESGAEPSKPSAAWVAHFRAAAKVETDADVEEMWARILAGEVKAPGSFSLRTLSVLRDVDEKTAVEFVHLLGFLFSGDTVPAWADFKQQYQSAGITYESLLRLVEAGLVHDGDARMTIDGPHSPDPTTDVVCGSLIVRLPKEPGVLAGRPLTIAGKELASIANRAARRESFTALVEWLGRTMSGSEITIALVAAGSPGPFRQWGPEVLVFEEDGSVRFGDTQNEGG